MVTEALGEFRSPSFKTGVPIPLSITVEAPILKSSSESFRGYRKNRVENQSLVPGASPCSQHCHPGNFGSICFMLHNQVCNLAAKCFHVLVFCVEGVGDQGGNHKFQQEIR